MSRRRRPRKPIVEEIAPTLGTEALKDLRDNPHLSDDDRAAAEIALGTIPDDEIDAEVQASDDAADEIAMAMDEDDDESGVTNETRKETDLEEIARDVWTPLGDLGSQNVANFIDTFPNPVDQQPEFDQAMFERGPLAAGIRMLEALLAEAHAGYVTAQIGELERVLDEEFTSAERELLGTVAAGERTAAGLPDVAGAYRALVGIRAQLAA